MWFVEDALGLQGTCHQAAHATNGRPPCVEAGSTLNFTPRGVKFEILTSTGSILSCRLLPFTDAQKAPAGRRSPELRHGFPLAPLSGTASTLNDQMLEAGTESRYCGPRASSSDWAVSRRSPMASSSSMEAAPSRSAAAGGSAPNRRVS
jgi:hypothetical protein